MINYIKLIKSQSVRYAILKALNFIPDRLMLKLQYYIKLGRFPDLSHPVRFTEWLQVYKLRYRNAKMQQCVDKFAVREYVLSKGLGHILVKLYGVYNSADLIDFSKMPRKFVIKTTNGGGGQNVIICKDKDDLDIKSIIPNLNNWLRLKTFNAGKEWAYDGIQEPKIIVEQFLENKNNPEAGIEDYKILCFGGIPQIVIVDSDRYIGHKRNFYDINWNRLNISSDCPPDNDTEQIKPANYDKMIEIASILSKDFPFVRVDLYNVDGLIYFGELTFYPWSGYVQFTPDDFDKELGSYFNGKLML